MKIVTYNVNGLRARLAPSRSLCQFLDSLDADIICLQETKVRRQELTADVAVAEGYESFFSCTRTVGKGRLGYSGVATFCRMSTKSNLTVPVAAEEGFTGLLHASNVGESRPWLGFLESVLEVEELSRQEVLELDIEGRCLVTDHGHFVLFNIYGPNVGGDGERQDFKLKFYKALQRRLESLMKHDRRVIVVGDLNIAPFAIDSCDPGPKFEQNPSRKWLRNMLVSGGGSFLDVFRVFHPDRAEAYTCWSQASGAEEFNYGTRIDLMLAAGPCSGHCSDNETCDGFVVCGIENCDILHAFKRLKHDAFPRWMGGRSLKLDGSDHAPVYLKLKDLPPVPAHDVPQLAAKFMPELRGRQQSLVSLFHKLGARAQTETTIVASTVTEESTETALAEKRVEVGTIFAITETSIEKRKKEFGDYNSRKVQRLSQSSLHSFCFQKSPAVNDKTEQKEETVPSSADHAQVAEDEDLACSSQPSADDGNVADEQKTAGSWDKLKQLLTQKNLPLCRGHREPCVVRTVKRPGPNVGRSFYVCARAKGPASNPEARCDHFQWTTSRSKKRK